MPNLPLSADHQESVPEAWAHEAKDMLKRLSNPELQVIFGLSGAIIAEREGEDAPRLILALVMGKGEKA